MTHDVPLCRLCPVPSSYLTPSGDLCEAHAVIHEPEYVWMCDQLSTPGPTAERWGDGPS
jgi:hypothetical protein